MPFRTSFRRTRFRANEADWPAEQTGTGIRFRSIDRIVVVVNWPKESGPIKTVSPACISPCIGQHWMYEKVNLRPGFVSPLLTIPETTVPTKGTEKVSLTWNSKGASAS